MEDLLRNGLFVVAGVAFVVLFGPRLLRLAGFIVVGFGVVGVLVKAPAESSAAALVVGSLIAAVGTWWTRRRGRRSQRAALADEVEADQRRQVLAGERGD